MPVLAIRTLYEDAPVVIPMLADSVRRSCQTRFTGEGYLICRDIGVGWWSWYIFRSLGAKLNGLLEILLRSFDASRVGERAFEGRSITVQLVA